MLKLPALLLTCLLLGGDDDVLRVDFELLADFEFVEGQPLPAKVRQLDGKIVRIGGFPRSFDGEVSDLKAFWLVSQNCDCEGIPKWNEMIWCTLPEELSLTINDEPVVLEGKLAVGEDREDEYLLSIYRLQVIKMLR